MHRSPRTRRRPQRSATLTGRHRNHRLVEQGHRPGPAAQRDQGLTLPHPGQRGEVPVTEPLGDLAGGDEPLQRPGRIVGETGHRLRDQEPPPLGAVEATLVQHQLGSGQPSATGATSPASKDPCAAHPASGLRARWPIPNTADTHVPTCRRSRLYR